MTKEEKAKAYDEAFEKAKMSYHTGDYDKDTLEMLEIIFPELRESEEDKDEKIRKWLIKYFNKADFNGMLEYVSGIKAEDILAWLEKQKHDLEDKEETVVYQGEVYTRVYRDELDKFACKYPKTVPLPSKKYRKYSETDLIIAVKEGAKWKMKQEPVWTEEDEKFLTSILRDVKHGEPLDKLQYDWLKSIRQRMQKGE